MADDKKISPLLIHVLNRGDVQLRNVTKKELARDYRVVKSDEREILYEKIALGEGFYEAELRNKTFLCYVHTTEKGILADLPNGKCWPVSPTPQKLPYILVDNLKPIDPTGYFNNAQKLIGFIFANLGRLEVSRRIQEGRLEQTASAQTLPLCTKTKAKKRYKRYSPFIQRISINRS